MMVEDVSVGHLGTAQPSASRRQHVQELGGYQLEDADQAALVRLVVDRVQDDLCERSRTTKIRNITGPR